MHKQCPEKQWTWSDDANIIENGGENKVCRVIEENYRQWFSVFLKDIFNQIVHEMHNRKKTNVAPSEAEVSALKKKAATYQSLIDIIFARRKSEDYSPETFDTVGKLIKMNPDFYSLWNFRKEILIRNHFPTKPEGLLSGPSYDAIRDEELNLSTEGIKRNPKSCKNSFDSNS